MRWHASIYSVEPVGDDGDTQRVLQLVFIFEADGDEDSARKQVAAVMPAVIAMLDAGASPISCGDDPALARALGDGFDLEVHPLAKYISAGENLFKDLKKRAEALSDDDGEEEYDGL